MLKQKKLKLYFFKCHYIYIYPLSVLDEKDMLFVSAVELIINSASLTFLSSIICRESSKTTEGSRSPIEISSHYFDL